MFSENKALEQIKSVQTEILYSFTWVINRKFVLQKKKKKKKYLGLYLNILLKKICNKHFLDLFMIQ